MIISNKWCAALSMALFAFFTLSCANDGSEVEEVVSSEDSSVTEYPLGFCPDSLEVVEGKVKNGQFFSTLLHSLGMSQQEAYNLTEACDSVFDVKTLRVGNGYQAYYDSSILEYLVYERDRASNIVFSCRPPYGAWVYEKPITVESRYADVTINTSLWNDMLAADVSPLLIVSLSDIYAWTIDFFGLQKVNLCVILFI